MILFALRSNVHGRFRDEEMVQRGASVILGAWICDYFAWLMRPVMAALVWAQVPPDAVSGVAVLVSILAGVVVSQGDFAPAAGCICSRASATFSTPPGPP